MKIQYNALTDPVTPEQLNAFAVQPEGRLGFAYSTAMNLIISGIFAVFVMFFTIGLTLSAFHAQAGLAVFLNLLVIAGIIVAGYFIGKRVRHDELIRRYRLVGFAKANSLSYNPRLANPNHPGMIFGDGYDRYAKDQLYSTSGDLFEIGDYYYTTGSGKSRQTHAWGYACVKLKRKVPNMVLDAKANNVRVFGMDMSNLPESLRGNSTLSLEGDFDKYFTLYAPKEYERDALYIFTPDLMAQLIDDSAQFDVEVVDDRMYIYSSVAFDVAQPATLQKIFAIINQVGEEMIEQTDYYADERVGDRQANIIAAPGRRLKHNVPVLLIVIIIVIFVGSQFFPFIWTFIHMLIHQ